MNLEKLTDASLGLNTQPSTSAVGQVTGVRRRYCLSFFFYIACSMFNW